MDIRAEIVARVDKLSREKQEEVLRFVSSLALAGPKAQGGAGLRRFSGLIDHSSAREMSQAIEEACERVDANEW